VVLRVRRVLFWIILVGVMLPSGAVRTFAEDGPKRVHGQAYSSTKPPPVTGDPSDEYLAGADGRKDTEPKGYTGLDDYELKNGAKNDNKKRWASTDFIRWLSSGATLIATGQVQDSDKEAASQVSSSAWGAQIIEAEVTKKEGDIGVISAENQISFSLTYDISGPRILDAKVLLSGACVDVKGETHVFSFADVRSETSSEGTSITRVRVAKQKDGVKVKAGASARGNSKGKASAGGSVGVRFESVYETEEGETINVSVYRSVPGAGGGTASESAPLITDSVRGKTTLKETYSVFSSGNVVLGARGSSKGTTVVLLNRFKIENSLKVFTKAERLIKPEGEEELAGEMTDGDGGDGTSGGASGGGSGSGSGSGAGSGSGDPDAGGITEGGITEAETSEEGGGAQSGTSQSSDWLALAGLDGSDGVDGIDEFETIAVRLGSMAPFGLADEGGSTTGELNLILNEPAPRDLVFSIAVDPPDRLVLLQGDTLTIPAGGRFVGGALEAFTDGQAVVSAHLLDESGQLSGRVVALSMQCGSTSVRGAPELYVCGEGDARQAGSGATIRGMRGRAAPALLIGRSGFDGYADVSTEVSLFVEDLDGILPPLPGTVTIPAGDAEVRIELPLQDVAGTARIVLQSGDASVVVTVVSRTQGWSALPVIRIPVGALAVVPFQLQWPEGEARDIVAMPTDGSIALPIVRPNGGGGSVHMVAGTTIEAATVRGVAVGRTTIRYESEGLPALEAIVDVVPARVRWMDGQIRLANLPLGAAGTIELSAPDGVVFSEVSVPPDAAGVLDVTGIGTGRITLHLTDSPDAPDEMAVGIQLVSVDGADGTPLVIDVDEDIEEDTPMPVRNSYRIEQK